MEQRKTPVVSWYLDLSMVRDYWGTERKYHHTAPINSLYALHEALVILQEEGLENAWARHERNHNALRAGIEAMGLSFFVRKGDHLPQLNAVTVPEGIDEAAVRKTLLSDYSLEIGAGLGPMAGKIWRIGLMGYSSNPRNVLACLNALEAVLARQGANIERDAALPAAQAIYE